MATPVKTPVIRPEDLPQEIVGVPVRTGRGSPFVKGHKRMGGRPKGSQNKRTKVAREIALAMGVDPIQFMLTVLSTDIVETVVTDADGKVVLDEKGEPKRELRVVPLDIRLDAAKAVAPYVHPRLQATQISVEEGTNRHMFPTEAILSNPKLADSLSELAILVAEGDDEKTLDLVAE